MNTANVVILTVFLTVMAIVLGWGIVAVTRNALKERRVEIREGAVRDVFRHWQWKSQEDRVNELARELYQLREKVERPAKMKAGK